MERRDFLKKGCSLCLMGAAGLLLPELLSSCTAGSKVFRGAVVNNSIEVPLSLFEAGNLQFVRPKGWYYDIAVHRREDLTYTAVLMQCTHMENQVAATGNGFICSAHGSLFDFEGQVKKGPAIQALKKYTTVVQDNNLIISI